MHPTSRKTTRTFTFTLLAIALLAPLGGHAAVAAERVMIMVDERVTDAPAATRVAEVRLAERLIGAGHQVVEAVETEAARRVVSVKKLLHGEIGAEISALNCDVLIVGETNSLAEEVPYGVTDMAAVSTEWTVTAVAVDTGRVLVSKQGSIGGAGTQERTAAAAARQKAADAMFEAVAKALSVTSAPAATVSLSVSDLQEIGDVETLRKRLEALDGIGAASVRFVSSDETRIEVTTSLDTWALGAQLEKVGLEVAQLSRGAISAKWTPWGAGKALVIGGFLNETGIAAHDWIEATLPEVFATELANSRYLRVVPADEGASLPDDTAAAIARAAKAAGADLFALGSLERVGPQQLRLSVTAYDAAGRTITAAQVFAAEPELVQRTRDLVWALDQRLFERLFAKGALAAYQPVFGGGKGRAPSASKGPDDQHARATVRIGAVALDDLYPSRLAAYATHPVGRITLANTGRRPATDVRVRVDIPGITTAPAVLKVDDIAPGAEREVPIVLVLDRARVQALSDNTPAQAEIALSWKDGGAGAGGEGTDLVTVPLVVFDKNALDWSEPEAIAAFTTHKDPSLDALARAAEREGRAALADVPDALRAPLSLFEALGASGLRYQADAKNPFGVARLDAVAFPAETLARKAGDCDDLSVLMAALLESQGVSTAFVLTPGHILVAWDTGVATAAAARLGLPAEAVIDRGGRAWVPLEVTRVGEPFGAAVMAGAAEYQRHRQAPEHLRFVDVAAAWQRFPPFPATFDKVAPALDGAFSDRLAASANGLLALAADDELARAPTAAELSDPDALNRIAVRLVERGQWRRAVDYFARAVALAGEGRPDLRYNLANVRVIEGKRDEARAVYRALEAAPALSAASLHGLGVLAYLDGATTDARKLFERSALPEAKEALTRLGLRAPAAPAKTTSRPRRSKPAAAPPPDPFLGIRAGVERVPLDELLLWLR